MGVRVVASSALVIFVAMLAFPFVARMSRLRLKRGISYLALALTFFYPVQITLGYAASKDASKAALFTVFSEIWGLLFLGVLLTMLITKNELDSPLTIPW
jgi:heme A synthase